jgi:predicted dehydrogenase
LRELAAALAAARSPVVVSFPLRVSALCQTAHAIVASGAIGTVEQAQAVNNVPFYAGGYYHGWMRDDRETGGLWLQKATHDLDYLTFLMGQRPARLCALESKTVFQGAMPAGLRCVECPQQVACPESPLNLFYQQAVRLAVEPNDWQCSFAVDTGNHDSATAIIQYEGGQHAVYTQNFYTRRGAAARGATLIGYRGTVQFDWYRSELIVHYHHTPRVERHQFEAGGDGHHGGDVELMHDFLGILTGTGRARATLADGILSCQLCLMARNACQTHAYQAFEPLAALTPAGA